MSNPIGEWLTFCPIVHQHDKTTPYMDACACFVHVTRHTHHEASFKEIHIASLSVRYNQPRLSPLA